MDMTFGGGNEQLLDAEYASIGSFWATGAHYLHEVDVSEVTICQELTAQCTGSELTGHKRKSQAVF